MQICLTLIRDAFCTPLGSSSRHGLSYINDQMQFTWRGFRKHWRPSASFTVGSQGPHATSGSLWKHALVRTSMIVIHINSFLLLPKYLTFHFPELHKAFWWGLSVSKSREANIMGCFFFFLSQKLLHFNYRTGTLSSTSKPGIEITTATVAHTDRTFSVCQALC